MISYLLSIFDIKLELLVLIFVAIVYVTYYLVDAVKVPEVICGDAELRGALRAVPTLRERYWPAPWCVEARLQTVLGSALRSLLLPPVSYTRQVVELEDGGRLALDWVCGCGGGGGERGVVVMVPGMTGGTQAEYVRCVAGAARALGTAAVVVNHRGTGAPLATPRLYSALSHGDLAAALAAVEARASPPLLGVGVSLGGLIMGQYLAATGARSRLAAALAVSAPLDVERAAAAMERAANAPLAWHMARNMRAAVRAQPALARHHAAVARARTLRQFDTAFTAAHVGFRSVEEYYCAATLRGKLGAVRAPLLCLCAADDPFQPRGALPAREAASSARVALAVTARGGHIGFLEGAWPRAAAHTFLARLTRDYFAALLERPHLLLHHPADAAL